MRFRVSWCFFLVSVFSYFVVTLNFPLLSSPIMKIQIRLTPYMLHSLIDSFLIKGEEGKTANALICTNSSLLLS